MHDKNKYNCSGPYLKVEDTEEVGLTKNYCVTVSMQKTVQYMNSFLQYSRFYGLTNLKVMPTESLKQLLAFLNLH